MHTDNTLNVLMQTDEKRHRFFAAWLRGVQLLGSEYFGPKSPSKAKHPSDLTPKAATVEAALPALSGGEQQLLAAMCSFYDPAWGEDLAARIGEEKSVCGLTFNLDHEEMGILCDLLINYCGWEEE